MNEQEVEMLTGHKETMTSLEIAEITGKNHSHIMRDIRNLLSQGVSESNFGLSSYKQPQPNGGTKNVPCYKLTKKGCLILAALVKQGNEIIKLSNEITSMRPKAEYYDKIMSCTDSIDITQVALDYGMSARALNKKLHELRIQYKVNKQWILYSDYLQCGYVRSIPVDISKEKDWSKTTNHTRWTRRGVIFIYEKLKTIGILPLMERQ